MEIISTIALTMGVAWASGINLYAAIFMLGYLGSTGHVALPPDLQVLTDPLVMFAAGLMYCVEFFADKTPGVDSAWDTIHSFIRIPAGAVLAMGAVGDTSQAAELTAFILGGALAGSTHATKMGSRILINTSPEPFTNWMASVGEDVAVIIGIWTALNHPLLFIGLMILFIGVMIWLLPKIWTAIKRVFRYIRDLFAGKQFTETVIAPDSELTPSHTSSNE